MAIAAGALSIWTQRLQLATVSDQRWMRIWPERLATAGDAVWFYLGKLFWPHPLSTNYPRWHIDTGQWVSYLPATTERSPPDQNRCCETPFHGADGADALQGSGSWVRSFGVRGLGFEF
jgi:hypothetical protein